MRHTFCLGALTRLPEYCMKVRVTGCVASIVLSIVLTIILNLLLRACTVR
jgi:tetrahydromethanopterin S-methyltransferase subunit F